MLWAITFPHHYSLRCTNLSFQSTLLRATVRVERKNAVLVAPQGNPIASEPPSCDIRPWTRSFTWATGTRDLTDVRSCTSRPPGSFRRRNLDGAILADCCVCIWHGALSLSRAVGAPLVQLQLQLCLWSFTFSCAFSFVHLSPTHFRFCKQSSLNGSSALYYAPLSPSTFCWSASSAGAYADSSCCWRRPNTETNNTTIWPHGGRQTTGVEPSPLECN